MNLWTRFTNMMAGRRLRAAKNDVVIVGRLWLHGPGKVVVGRDSKLDGGKVGIELRTFPGAELHIGARCLLSEGVSIETSQSIIIGDNTRIGPFVKVMDSNFHSLHGNRHERPPPHPIVIEEGVELGERAIVLPGVTIGAGAKVQPGAVVTRRVPAGVVVAGNPARPVRV